jgi:hypothetical protein
LSAPEFVGPDVTGNPSLTLLPPDAGIHST